MEREEAKELLPIIQAFAEGKTIQVWANGTWQDEDYPFFWTIMSIPHKARTSVQTLQDPRRVLERNAETSAIWVG